MTLDSEFELTADLTVLRVYRNGAAAQIELHRPERMNAWNGELGVALRTTVAELGADPGVRAVLITGAAAASPAAPICATGLLRARPGTPTPTPG